MNDKQQIQQLRDRLNHNGTIEADIILLANSIARIADSFKNGIINQAEIKLITEDMAKLADKHRETNKSDFKQEIEQ